MELFHRTPNVRMMVRPDPPEDRSGLGLLMLTDVHRRVQTNVDRCHFK